MNIMKRFFIITMVLSFVSGPVVLADNDRDDDDDDRFSFFKNRAQSNPLYKEECGSCHLAYPAKFMSRDGWSRIMASLDNHFGDNAELDAVDNKTILDYLQANASKESRWGWGRTSESLRITDNRHFKREHDEVPFRAVGTNAKVKSLADCQACHQNAEQGSFRESEIRIPGFASWDD